MMVLCNQPEAFASDLGDDQSRFLCVIGRNKWLLTMLVIKTIVIINIVIIHCFCDSG